MWGPMGDDWRLRRSVSSDEPAVLTVTCAVLMVLACLSMKLLDIGYGGWCNMLNVLICYESCKVMRKIVVCCW